MNLSSFLAAWLKRTNAYWSAYTPRATVCHNFSQIPQLLAERAEHRALHAGEERLRQSFKTRDEVRALCTEFLQRISSR
jgi:hypothetical protein